MPGDTAISGLKGRFSNLIEAHDIGKVCVSLAEGNCKVGDSWGKISYTD